MVGLAAIVYFVMIRPQTKQLKEQRDLLASLMKGDDVVTQGGVIGKILAVAEKTVTLEVANGVKLRVLKSAIQARGAVVDDAPKTDDASAKKEEK